MDAVEVIWLHTVWLWGTRERLVGFLLSGTYFWFSLERHSFFPIACFFSSDLMQTGVALEIALDCLARIVFFGVVGGGKACLKASISSLFWIPSCWLIGNHNKKQKEHWRGSCQPRAWLLLGQMSADWENSGFKKNWETFVVEGNTIVVIGIYP